MVITDNGIDNFFLEIFLGTKIKKWEQIQGEGLFLEITAFLGTKIKKAGTDLK